MAKVACIGAGTVGRAWTVVFARAGYEVAAYDASAGEVRSRAIPQARATLVALERAGLLGETADTIAGRIRGADTVAEAVADAVYVQESVSEAVATKREVLSAIAAAAPVDAIIGSSTSAIPGSKFLGHVPNPGRALVVHPVNPPSLIPLVELCATPWTTAETLERARTLMLEAGMRPIVVRKEIDGFILNRLQFTLVAEAMHLVGEGYCTAEDVDAVLTHGLALRWAFVGPFEVAHLNAPDGMQGFVDRLGPMMRRLGADARTDYDWTPEQVRSIHQALAKRIPLDAIAARQAWRDERIVALRKLQGEDSEDRVGPASGKLT